MPPLLEKNVANEYLLTCRITEGREDPDSQLRLAGRQMATHLDIVKSTVAVLFLNPLLNRPTLIARCNQPMCRLISVNSEFPIVINTIHEKCEPI